MKKVISVDIIEEATPGIGTTIGGVLLKDGAVNGTNSAYVAHSLAAAANDFLVASGSGVFVKKTQLETQTILGIRSNYTAQEEISEGTGGAISLTAFCTYLNIDTSGDAFTLANSTVSGQLKKIILRNDPGSAEVATVTGEFTGTSKTLTFSNAGEFVLLYWNGTIWVVIESGSMLNMTDAPVLSTV